MKPILHTLPQSLNNPIDSNLALNNLRLNNLRLNSRTSSLEPPRIRKRRESL